MKGLHCQRFNSQVSEVNRTDVVFKVAPRRNMAYYLIIAITSIINDEPDDSRVSKKAYIKDVICVEPIKASCKHCVITEMH